MASQVRFRPAFAVLTLLVSLGLVQPQAQQSASPQPAPAAGLPVTVDFFAVADDGRPVTDLKPEELSLKVDGKARAVHSMDLIQVPGAQAGHDAGQPLIAPPFGTNAAMDTGRTIVLVIDDESIRTGSERSTQQAAMQFLAGLSPRDRVSVITVPHGGMKVDLTSDFEKVKQAIGTITGQAPQSETIDQATCRTRSVLQSLTGMLESLSGGQGPVTVIFFTTSMTSSRSPITFSRTAANQPSAQSLSACELQPEEFEHVGTAAAAARAHFYVIRPEMTAASTISSNTSIARTGGSTNVRGSDSIDAGIADLTGVTGGPQFPIAGTGDNALVRIALETSSYYQVTFEPEANERNGLAHKLELHFSRPGLTLRALPSVVIPPVDAHGAVEAPTPRTMVLTTRPYRDLGLRATGFASRHTLTDANGRVTADSRVKIIALFEPLDPLSTLTSAMAGLVDSTGHVVQQWVATPNDLTQSPMTAALLAPPGRYRMRIAATDKTGRSGATDFDVDAELIPSGSLKMSSLLLGRSIDGHFTPKLQFSDEAVAIAYLELYGIKDNMKAAVAIELAKTADGPAFLAQSAALDPTSDPDRYIVQAALPIGGLPAGDYVVRALVVVQGDTQPIGHVIRTLRKTAK